MPRTENKNTQSKSDAVLAAQLGDAPKGKSNPAAMKEQLRKGGKSTTISEAKAQAADANGDDGSTTPSKGKRAAKGDGTVRAPRVRVEPGAKATAILAAHVGDEGLHTACSLVTGDEPSEENTNTVRGIVDKLAKKIGEKAANLMRFAGEPSKLQVFTRIGMDELIARGELTSKDLISHYQHVKYSPGTARAQTNQIMNLLPALNVAERVDRGTIKLNAKSPIVKAYRKAERATTA